MTPRLLDELARPLAIAPDSAPEALRHARREVARIAAAIVSEGER